MDAPKAHLAVEAVILDLGNVLVFHDNALLFRRLGERAGLDGAVVERRLAGAAWDAANRGEMTREEIWRGACHALGLSLAAGDFNELWCCHFRVNEAVLPLVESLVGRVELLLLSNSNPIHVEHLRPLLPILRRFDHVLFSCGLGRRARDGTARGPLPPRNRPCPATGRAAPRCLRTARDRGGDVS
jgi:putative hydrolase of the HAD superfamily